MDHISTTNNIDLFSNSSDGHVVVNGPLIIGAGPSGLAVAACLKDQGVPYIILDRADCIASLWQNRTYNRLKLHLPKQFCQLPKLSFPESFPKYPTKSQFISYLETYAQRFDIQARFNQCVRFAKLEESLQLWRVRTGSTKVGLEEEIEYLCRWLVVASGENAECVVPDIDGMADFDGKVIHSSEYRTGDDFRGQKVLVVGCGNSGMELSLDLANHHALPSLVCRSSVHVLPREIMGRSTFELAMTLLKWIPLLLVDKILLIFTWLMLGNIEKIGLKRPKMGPIELKNKHGKSPVLDIGALAKIRSGHIKIVPGIKKFVQNGVELVHGDNIEVDSVILATGYRSNVPYWLQDGDFFDKNGFPKSPFSNGWKGKDGLYAAGFTRRGLSGASFDAIRIAQDIGMLWKDETKHNKLNKAYLRRCISSF